MKVELQCGDKITIPEGCKAQINGSEIVVEKEEAKMQDFKDGDVLTLLHNNKGVFIFREDELKQKNNENGYYVGYAAGYRIDVPSKGSPFFYGHRKDVRHATEEEKQFLFDIMKEKGLRWNAEEKRVEKIRWRANKRGYYYFLDADLSAASINDTYSTFDNNLWDTYNYFRTKGQAEEAAKRVRETLEKYCEEIGE